MPTDTRTVRIFFASPSDVVEELALLSDSIEDLAYTFGPHQLSLDLVHWTRVIPDRDDDAQAIINRGVGEAFDLFIATMWTRVGSPTKRAQSGTIEEYERALAIAERRPDFRVWVFFNTSPPDSLDDLDLEQIAAVRSFKQRVSDDGCLFREYRGSAEFGSLLRRLLGRYLGELSAGTLSSRDSPSSESPSAAGTNGPKVLGYFDYAREATEQVKVVGDVNVRLAQTCGKACLAVTERAAELDGTDHADNEAFAAALEAYGASLFDFGEAVVPFSDQVEVSYARALGSYANAIVYLGDLVDDLAPHACRAVGAVSEMREATSTGRARLAHIRAKIDRVPRLSGDVITGKARAIGALDELLNRYDTALRLTDETMEAMRSAADSGHED